MRTSHLFLGICGLLSVLLNMARCDGATFVDVESRADEYAKELVAGLSSNGREVWNRVVADSRESGRMPSHSRFLLLLSSDSLPLTRADRLALFAAFGRIQRPRISRTELRALLHEQRTALNPMHVTYEVRKVVSLPGSRGSARPIGDEVLKCQFLRMGVMIQTSESVVRNAEVVETLLESYDGTSLRTVLTGTDIYPNVTRSHLDTRRRFFQSGNPLVCALQVDASVEAGREWLTADLLQLVGAYFVYEAPELYGGIECLVIGNETTQCLCSPAHGFAVMVLRTSGIELDQVTGGYRNSSKSMYLVNSEFEQLDDHVWLPMRSESRTVRDGTIVEHFVTKVERYSLSPNVTASTFSDIYPDHAVAADTVDDRTYVIRPLQSDDRISTSQSGSFRWALLVLNLVTVAAILTVLWMRRRDRGT